MSYRIIAMVGFNAMFSKVMDSLTAYFMFLFPLNKNEMGLSVYFVVSSASCRLWRLMAEVSHLDAIYKCQGCLEE